MIKKPFFAVILTLMFAMMIGCSNEAAAPVDQPSKDGNAALHSQHAAQQNITEPEPSNADSDKKAIYSLDAASYEEDGRFYVKATTNLKLSSEHYGGKPVDGEGHIHVYVNGGIVGPIKDDTPYALSLIKNGTYEIKLVLAENNHVESFGVSKELSIEKKE